MKVFYRFRLHIQEYVLISLSTAFLCLPVLREPHCLQVTVSREVDFCAMSTKKKKKGHPVKVFLFVNNRNQFKLV